MLRAGAAAVRNGDADAYVTDEWTLQWYAGRQPCNLLVQGDNFGPGVLVYGLQKDSPFTTLVNKAMLEVSFIASCLPLGAGIDVAGSACICIGWQCLS